MLLLGGCIPRSASVPPAPMPPPVAPPIALQTANTAPAPSLDLDLSTLTDAPIWEMRPVTADATVVRARTLVVKPGETLRSIGEASGVGIDALARANRLVAPFSIRAGQILAVPAGSYHRVREGETGIAIARAYATSWSRVVEANGLTEPFVLRVGQRLVLPEPATATPTAVTPEARAAAFQIGIDDVLTGGEPARLAPPVAPTIRTAGAPSMPTRFVWPLGGALVSRFGRLGAGRANQGIDIAAKAGAGVGAAASGTVAYVGSGVPGYGGLILVRHAGDWITAYGRIASASVAKGDTVKSGQTIAKSGSEPLHFELRRVRVPVDPVRYLPAR